jgi:hypothetical protein
MISTNKKRKKARKKIDFIAKCYDMFHNFTDSLSINR